MTRHDLLVAFALWITAAAVASAHPVAQGALDVRIAREHLTVRARVSVEQVFVESSLGTPARAADTLGALWPAHGEYLLAHLFIAADQQRLTGRILGITPPPVPTADQMVLYELRYDFTAGAAPARLTLQQDLLNEFTYAPGNRWEATFVARIEQEGQTPREGLLLTAQHPVVIECGAPAAPLDRRRLALDYVRHGIEHILRGWDHLLFMAALVLAAVTVVDLVKVVTAFTVAHTLTLALSVLDLLRLPSQIVEPMIAASIVFVAAQNMFFPERARGWSRLFVAFAFGLFHGLGFAGGLVEAMQGLPGLTVATAIVAFSLGVELGHQVVALPLFCALRLARARRPAESAAARAPALAMRLGSALISLAGIFYFVTALRG
jgi:hydrogenase/urease accessory protein HupE